MNYAEEVLTGKRCQYCEQPTEYVDSKQVYGRSYGMIYLCRACWAYVGVHKGTTRSLGTVANADLRALRKTAHTLFDSLWKRSRKNKSRTAAYAWLAQQLDMIPGLTHMGMFDEETCERVIEICRPIYERRKEEIRQSHANQPPTDEPTHAP